MPVAAALDAMGAAPPVVFFCAAVAILPLAILIVHSTEHLAARTGPAIGGLLNATCGNLPELIIALVALRAGLLEMVRGSLIGALLANLLLALGLAFFVGGLRHRTQEYNPAGARTYASMMLLSAVAMVVPSTFHRLNGDTAPQHAQALDTGVVLVLLAAYVLYLVFMLRTHPEVFAGAKAAEVEPGVAQSTGRAGITLLAASLGAAWMSEILVGAAEATGHALGMSPMFIGIVLLAIVGRRRRERGGHRHGPQEPDGPVRGHRHGQLHPDRALRHPGAGAAERVDRTRAPDPGVQPRGDRRAVPRGADRRPRGGGRTLELVQGRPAHRVLHHPGGDVLPDPCVSRLGLVSGRFRLLLLALFLAFGGTAVASGTRAERLVNAMLLALVLVAAVLDLREREHRWRFAGLAAGIILLSGVDLNVRVPYLAALVDAMMVVFAGLVVWRAYTVVMRRQRPVADRIVGAICVYVLLGLAWAKTYEALDGVAPGSFRFPADTAWAAPGLLRYIYFSFVTLATVGYGDVSPVTALAGTLAWMEAITGQLYLAVTVARLVALSIADSSTSRT